MKRSLYIGILTWATLLWPRLGFSEPADPLFSAGKEAYDHGQYADAVAQYDRLLADGWIAPEVYFNRGNALVRLGRTGEAIASYETARLLRPRDADIAANLRFVRTQAGLPTPPPKISDHVFGVLTRFEWRKAALVGWWWAALALASSWIFPAHARTLRALAGMGALLLAISAGGLLYHELQARHPVVVVTEPGHQALFAPLTNATPHFDAAEGLVVRLQADTGEWLQVTDGKRVGWLPATACRIVRLAHSPAL